MLALLSVRPCCTWADDVVIASTYKVGDEEGQERAVERLSDLKYHDSMVLERTDDEQRNGKDTWKEKLE